MNLNETLYAHITSRCVCRTHHAVQLCQLAQRHDSPLLLPSQHPRPKINCCLRAPGVLSYGRHNGIDVIACIVTLVPRSMAHKCVLSDSMLPIPNRPHTHTHARTRTTHTHTPTPTPTPTHPHTHTLKQQLNSASWDHTLSDEAGSCGAQLAVFFSVIDRGRIVRHQPADELIQQRRGAGWPY
jgi:hypothetical protein